MVVKTMAVSRREPTPCPKVHWLGHIRAVAHRPTWINIRDSNMHRAHCLGGTTAVVFLAMTGICASTQAQDAPKAANQPGCTTVNGVSTGAGCNQGAGNAAATGGVENGMPATKHQEEVLKAGDKVAQGQNLDATGPAGGGMPATQHQQDVLKKNDAPNGSSNTSSP